MISAASVLLLSVGFAFVCALAASLLGMYTNAGSLWRRATWVDDATLGGKARTTLGWLRRNVDWKYHVKMVAATFVVTWAVGIVSILIVVGYVEVFLW